MESASNNEMTNYRNNVHRVYNGKMLDYIQTTGEKGRIEVTLSAPWLKPAKVSLTLD